MQCDLGNLCQMMLGCLKSISIALQDGDTGRAVSICQSAMRVIKLWEGK